MKIYIVNEAQYTMEIHFTDNGIIIYYSHRPLGISKIISRGAIAPSEIILDGRWE